MNCLCGWQLCQREGDEGDEGDEGEGGRDDIVQKRDGTDRDRI